MLERADVGAEGLSACRSGGLYSLAGVICAVGLYSLLHVAARLLASGNLGEDDPLEAILTQTLALGYQPDQPPLYDWALWLLERVTGTGVVHFQLLKYALLTATCGFIFLSARRVMKGDALWAFLSVEALALIYQISWRFHEGFTHQVGAMCAVAATFWALLRLIENERWKDYAILGVTVGLGVLTVTTYWIYLGTLLSAAAMQPAIRSRLVQPGSCLTLAIAGLIAAPHFVWLAATPQGIGATMLPFGTGDLPQVLKGVRRAFTEPLMYLAPLIFLYPIFFPAMPATVWRTTSLRPNTGICPDYEQLILHMALLSIGALILGALFFGVYSYPTHALMPLFLITSIWLTAQARRAAASEGQMRRFVIMALSVAVFAFFARAANMYVLEPVCNICRWGIPYAELADAMKARGFEAEQGRIVVTDWELGGNLRRFFPNTPIVLFRHSAHAPPRASNRRQTAILWAGEEDAGQIADYLGHFLPDLNASDLTSAQTIEIPWRDHLWKPDGYRHSRWRLLLRDRPAAR